MKRYIQVLQHGSRKRVPKGPGIIVVLRVIWPGICLSANERSQGALGGGDGRQETRDGRNGERERERLLLLLLLVVLL